MCRPVACRVCGKTTWAGCGQHVDEVRRTVPAAQWCPGHDAASSARGGGGTTGSTGGGVIGRLFGR